MPRNDGIDELDPRFPIRLDGPAPLFWHLIRHPPVKARWRAHLDFSVDETRRAMGAEHVWQETFVRPAEDTMPVPVIRVPVARTYPELSEDTLTREFSGLPAALAEGAAR